MSDYIVSHPLSSSWIQECSRALKKARQQVQDWCIDTSCVEENLFVKRLRAAGLTPLQVLSVIEAVGQVCRHCYNRDACSCRCWDDS